MWEKQRSDGINRCSRYLWVCIKHSLGRLQQLPADIKAKASQDSDKASETGRGTVSITFLYGDTQGFHDRMGKSDDVGIVYAADLCLMYQPQGISRPFTA